MAWRDIRWNSIRTTGHPLAVMTDARWACLLSSPLLSSHNIMSRGIFDIRYLTVENHSGSENPMMKALFFDLGCTVYSEETYRHTVDHQAEESDSDKFNYTSGSGSGPSIPLFYNMFRDRCIEFDAIYAFEGKAFLPHDWWRPVPFSMRHKIHFYNTFVEELSLKDSVQGKVAGHSSFLRMLPLVAKPGDFVVIKLDIDGGPEMEIACAIAARPELSSLVDVLFFEFNFDEPGLNPY